MGTRSKSAGASLALLREADERSDRDERREQQEDFDVIDNGVAGRGAHERLAERAAVPRASSPRRCERRRRNGEAGRGRLHGAPGAERQTAICPAAPAAMAAVSVPRANRPPPKPISVTPTRNSAGESAGAAKITAREGDDADKRANAGEAVRVGAARRASARRARSRTALPSASIAVSAVVAPTARCRTRRHRARAGCPAC